MSSNHSVKNNQMEREIRITKYFRTQQKMVVCHWLYFDSWLPDFFFSPTRGIVETNDIVTATTVILCSSVTIGRLILTDLLCYHFFLFAILFIYVQTLAFANINDNSKNRSVSPIEFFELFIVDLTNWLVGWRIAQIWTVMFQKLHQKKWTTLLQF